MAGLDPAIHLFERVLRRLMDARVKPAHDEVCFLYGPGSAAHQAAKGGPLRCVRGTECVGALTLRKPRGRTNGQTSAARTFAHDLPRTTHAPERMVVDRG